MAATTDFVQLGGASGTLRQGRGGGTCTRRGCGGGAEGVTHLAWWSKLGVGTTHKGSRGAEGVSRGSPKTLLEATYTLNPKPLLETAKTPHRC